MDQTKIYLNASIVFAALSACLFVGAGYAASSVSPMLAILSGMTTMGALTSFQRFLEAGGRNPVAQISFNEAFLRTSIEVAFRKLPKERQPSTKQLPWDITSNQLIGVVNALALAKLRMDIESELRRIAHLNGLPIADHSFSVKAIARQLSTAQILPTQFLEPMGEIAEVCNRGVHGEEVPNELTASVVRIGNQLLEALRLLPENPSLS